VDGTVQLVGEVIIRAGECGHGGVKAIIRAGDETVLSRDERFIRTYGTQHSCSRALPPYQSSSKFVQVII